MDTPLIDDATLLCQIETFCDRTGVRPSTFGRDAIGDGNLVANLKAGRSMTLKSAGRVLAFMAAYQPPADARAA